MLRPASRPAHHFTCGSLQWLSLIAIEVNPSHATTTGSRPGVDLGVVFLAHHFTRGFLQWLSLIAIEVNPSHATTTRSRPGIDLGVVFLVQTPCTLGL